jgi:hypothetical protein
MIRDIALSLAVLIGVSKPLVLRLIPFELQWIYWNMSLLVMMCLISAIFFFEIKYNHFFRKFFSFLVMCISYFSMFDYVVRVYIESGTVEYMIIYASYFVIFGCFFAFLTLSTLRFFIRSSEIYKCPGSFIAYSLPMSFSGLIAAIFKAPYGHCSLIVNGRKFSFKNGKVIESAFEGGNSLVFKRIGNVDINEARKLIGQKWTLSQNCFTVFRRFR